MIIANFKKRQGANHGFLSLCFQKGFVFVGGGAADVAHSRQFADV